MIKAETQQIIEEFAKKIQQANGTAFYVGGMVRDKLMGNPIKDIDIEVYGLQSIDQLKSIANKFGAINEVGKSFAVLKLSTRANIDIDISFPRTESKSGPGHKGFSIIQNGHLSFEEACKRRDFTINSMLQNILTNKIVDPYNGQKDLKNKCLRHVSNKFTEDPLRVFRAAQFAARFNFTLAKNTIELCKQLPLTELSKERIFEEIKKLCLKSNQPSIGFNILKETQAIKHFPQLESLINTPQDPEWHPEGDVWTHTLMVLDEMVKLKTTNETKNIILCLAALCHDLGKPSTTKRINNRWRSPGHEAAGVEPTEAFLSLLTNEKNIIEPVKALVNDHLKPTLLFNANKINHVTDSAIRRLSTRVPIADLVTLATADHFGRSTPDAKKRLFEAGNWLLKRAHQLNVSHKPPQPLIFGRDLLALGLPPGKQIGLYLKQVYDKQLSGELTTQNDALEWIKKLIP